VLAGNWRPTLLTRLKLAYFFLLVRIQRRFALVPRHHAFLIPEEASGR
jgi:hypothetical protein